MVLKYTNKKIQRVTQKFIEKNCDIIDNSDLYIKANILYSNL